MGDRTGAVPGGRSLVVLVCLVLAGCGPAGPTGAATGSTGAATGPSGAATGSAGAMADWSDRAYRVTCDGVVPDGFAATVVDGQARVPANASRPPYYDHYDIRVLVTARGDLDGDGAPDAVVLLDCSPQPSNGIVQEVLLFSSTGRPLGELPSPRTLQGDAPLPPEYDPAGLSIEDGEIVAAMMAYGPNDVHASGPSLPLTVRWRYDGHGVVRVSS